MDSGVQIRRDMDQLLNYLRGGCSKGGGGASWFSGGELQEFMNMGNMVQGEESVSGLHDLLHVLLPDIPEPGAEGPLSGASGLAQATADVDRDRGERL